MAKLGFSTFRCTWPGCDRRRYKEEKRRAGVGRIRAIRVKHVNKREMYGSEPYCWVHRQPEFQETFEQRKLRVIQEASCLTE